MFSFISVPTNLTANIGTQVSDLVGGLSPYVVYVLGIFIGLFVLEWIIGVLERPLEKYRVRLIRNESPTNKTLDNSDNFLEDYQEDF